MKKLLTILFACTCVLAIQAQETAEQVTDRFLQLLEKQALQTSFHIVVADQASEPMAYNGNIVMQGERFVLNMFGTEAAYDGKTLYIYSPESDELTLSAPTQQELVEANPLLFAKAMRKNCTLRFSTAQLPEQYSIDFIPTEQGANVQKLVIKLSKTTLCPIEIQIREGKQRTTLSFMGAKFGPTDSNFTLSKENAFINDLR